MVRKNEKKEKKIPLFDVDKQKYSYLCSLNGA